MASYDDPCSTLHGGTSRDLDSTTAKTAALAPSLFPD
jgi:hypothetical protein